MPDGADHPGKPGHVISENDMRDVTIARMEAPCCGGPEQAVKQVLERSGKSIPRHVVAIGAGGSRRNAYPLPHPAFFRDQPRRSLKICTCHFPAFTLQY